MVKQMHGATAYRKTEFRLGREVEIRSKDLAVSTAAR